VAIARIGRYDLSTDAHGGIVIAVALLAFGGYVRFHPAAVWRSFGFLLGYAALVGAVNALLGSNYMFLCGKPDNPSLLDQMGPWLWYLVGGAAASLAFFWLSWLPMRHWGGGRESSIPAERTPRPIAVLYIDCT
jgi:uncharacterized membrane protein YwaF